MNDELPEAPALCDAACPHESVVRCTLPGGHAGAHEHYGDRYPGNPEEKSVCTWKKATR